ncbi:glycoside hydrolase superfamily [Xylariales sp. PMI_506]|nr:glycoside hydrolase superfamily [Xylariales sp. PMI_506]
MAILSKLVAFGSFAVLAAGQTAVTISTTKYQTVDGFGFSQAFGRALQFQDMTNTTAQKVALDYLFSTTTGAGFSIIRNRIGSNGTGDSIEPTSPGTATSTPTYVWDDNDSGQVWFTTQAVSYGVKNIYADAWSAPGFMKTSGSDQLPGYLCGTTGHTCSTGDWRQAYANFLVQYVKYYASVGLSITHLGFLNEPDYTVSYSQMQISSNAVEAIDFIPILNQTVKAAGLTTKIACCDAIGWTSQSSLTNYLVAAGSTSYLNLITSHSYTSDATTPLSQTSLPKWNTEAGPSSAWTTTWYSSGADNEGFTWAQKLAVAMVNAQLSAYLFWEGFELDETVAASHLVDTPDGVNPQPSGIFWAFAMWSRYIRPGAVMLGTSGSPSNVITGAFLNTDGSLIAVITNSGTSSASIALSYSGFTPGSASAWVTQQGTNFGSTSASLSGGVTTVSVPAKGVVTTTTTTTTTSSSTSTSSSPTSTCTAVAQYGQCGGITYSGCKTCASGYTCTYFNDYYSQCL